MPGDGRILATNWPNRARHWSPSVDHPSDKATVTWRVTASPAKTVIANGKLVSTKTVRADGIERQETVWRETKRLPVYLMVIAVAPLVEVDLGDTARCGLAEQQRCVPQEECTSRRSNAVECRGRLRAPVRWSSCSRAWLGRFRTRSSRISSRRRDSEEWRTRARSFTPTRRSARTP